MAVRPLRHVLVLALLRVVGAAIGGAAVFGVFVLVQHDVAGTSTAQQRRVAVDPVDPVADLIQRHHCWSGAAPADMAGQVPGHAIVRLPRADSAEMVDSSVGFGIWLDGDPGHLYAFCR